MASFPVFRRWKELGKVWPSCWRNAVIYFVCAGSRILWIKFKFSGVKDGVMVGYGRNEVGGEERYRFWNHINRVLDRVYIDCAFGEISVDG